MRSATVENRKVSMFTLVGLQAGISHYYRAGSLENVLFHSRRLWKAFYAVRLSKVGWKQLRTLSTFYHLTVLCVILRIYDVWSSSCKKCGASITNNAEDSFKRTINSAAAKMGSPILDLSDCALTDDAVSG